MPKRKLVTLAIIAVGFFIVFLSLNQPAMAKERIVEFDNPGCE